MAIVSLNTIKNWFKTGLKPTQQQFWDTWDSFFHKEEGIATTYINGLDSLLNTKADKIPFEHHLTDEEAHGSLFKKAKIYHKHELQIFKAPTNILNELEVGDIVIGIIEGKFVKAIYSGGNATLINNYELLEEINLNE